MVELVQTALVALAIVCVALAFALPVALHVVLGHTRKIQAVGGEPVGVYEQKLEIEADARRAAEDRRHDVQMRRAEMLEADKVRLANGG